MKLTSFATFRNWRDHQQIDERGAVTVTDQSDVIRVTAERRDVLLDPVQCCHLVEHGVVARRVTVTCTQESCQSQTSSLVRQLRLGKRTNEDFVIAHLLVRRGLTFGLGHRLPDVGQHLIFILDLL